MLGTLRFDCVHSHRVQVRVLFPKILQPSHSHFQVESRHYSSCFRYFFANQGKMNVEINLLWPAKLSEQLSRLLYSLMASLSEFSGCSRDKIDIRRVSASAFNSESIFRKVSLKIFDKISCFVIVLSNMLNCFSKLFHSGYEFPQTFLPSQKSIFES